MSDKKRFISSVRSNLKYIQEDVDSALAAAIEVKDPELTKKLETVKGAAKEAKDYLASRVDPKQG